MIETSFLVEMLVDVLISLVAPVLLGISMFVVWRALRSAAIEGHSAFAVMAKGFGFLFLSIAVPFLMGVAALLLGDSADEMSEFWFSVPAAALTVVGAVYIALGARRFVRQAPAK